MANLRLIPVVQIYALAYTHARLLAYEYAPLYTAKSAVLGAPAPHKLPPTRLPLSPRQAGLLCAHSRLRKLYARVLRKHNGIPASWMCYLQVGKVEDIPLFPTTASPTCSFVIEVQARERPVVS